MEEKPPEIEPDEEKSNTPDGRKEEGPKGKRTDKQKATVEPKSRDVKRTTGSARSRIGRRGSSVQNASPPPGATTPASDNDGLRLVFPSLCVCLYDKITKCES